MNKLLRMIPLFLISLTIVIFGIFEYVKYGFALFVFLIIVFFAMLLLTNSMTDGMNVIDRYKTQLKPVSLVIFVLVTIYWNNIKNISIYTFR